MAKPLALTDVAHGEQKGWRRNQHLVDSLPYVDAISDAEKKAVVKLIEEEVSGGGCRSLPLAARICAVQNGAH
jgi:pre-mRNA-splicing factor SPF27